MKTFSLIGISIVFASLIFGAINNNIIAFGETFDPNQNDIIEMEGDFNILEIIYADGTIDRKYYLFVDETGSNAPVPYNLEITNPPGSLLDLVSEKVLVRGHIANSPVQFSPSFSEIKIMTDSIEKINSIQEVQSYPAIAQTEVEGTPVPSTLQSFVILSKFSDAPGFEPYDTSYFDNLLFNSTAGAYSLTNYLDEASYGALNFTSSGINDWSTLANATGAYGDLTNPTIFGFTDDVIAASGPIDFNGPDDIIQNSSPSNLLMSGDNGDDIDQLFFIYNGNSFGACSCAFAFLGPIGIDTVQGTMFFLTSYTPALGPAVLSGFAVDTGYRGGFGVIAHEVGHSFGWDHTPTPPPFGGLGPYADPWSPMSKISDSIAENASGPIAYNRSHAGWIPPADIITISNNQTLTFTLDKLSDPSPGPGYLMANVTFGGGTPTDYYTLEARIDDTFDHTPESKTALLMYHVSQTGHPATAEPTAEASIVDINGAMDISEWKDADLALGENFTVNGVTVSYLADNATSITVQVDNNVSFPSLCAPPGAGDWIITVSCTMTSSETAAGNVIVQSPAVLTIPSGFTLTIPSGFGATVNSGGGISVELGGTLIIIS